MATDHHHHQHHEHNHVHFPPEQLKAHDLEILIKYSEHGQVHVHLGFLQINHYYHVKFSIKDTLGEDIVTDPVQNVNVQLKGYAPTEDGEGHELTIDFKAYKEKLMEELLIIRDVADSSKTVNIVFHARVLGKGKGTPALKNGISCYKVDTEDDSEANSDWQGFE